MATIAMAILHNPKYRNKWIAMTENRKKVVGCGGTPAQAVKESRKNGVNDPILTRVPENAASYVI